MATEMSDIQDEAYTELCRENARLERKVSDLTRDCIYGHNAEIERLSARCAFMASNDYVYSLTSEIERLKALMARAAEALAGCTWQERDALIAELRKAVNPTSSDRPRSGSRHEAAPQ